MNMINVSWLHSYLKVYFALFYSDTVDIQVCKKLIDDEFLHTWGRSSGEYHILVASLKYEMEADENVTLISIGAFFAREAVIKWAEQKGRE